MLEFDHLRVTLGGNTVVDDLNLEIGHSKVTVLIGPSGCGKSVLFRSILGLLPLSEGAILGLPQLVAVAFQDALLIPWLNIEDNLKFSLSHLFSDKEEFAGRMKEYLGMAGLAGVAEKYPHQLSGGMKQRVNLLRALLTPAEVSLYDEPLAQVDQLQRHEILQHLVKMWKSSPSTVLFVTHDLDEALYVADQILVFSEKGMRVIDSVYPKYRDLGAPDEVRQQKEYGEIYKHLYNQLRRETT